MTFLILSRFFMVRKVLKMYKISRVSALSEIMEEIEKNNYEVANKMMAIVIKSIKSDKVKNQYTSYISLSKKETKLFKNYIEDNEEQD